MDEGQIEKLKARLLGQKMELREMTDSLGEAGRVVELDQTRVGRLSRMDAMQGQQMALASKRRQQQKLLAIESALQRISQGDYGNCVKCDEPINPLRLEADPTHSLCIDCAE